MRLEKIDKCSSHIQKTVGRFLNILTGKDDITTNLDALLRNANTHLFFAFDEEHVAVGMITLVIVEVASGSKAWIEDVVVDNKFQGQGIGKIMIDFIVKFARDEQVSLLMLTSKPSRVAANALYQKMGFDKKETNVYQMIL